MVLPHGYGDLYHKYRPLRFEEIAGHKEIIKSIRKAILAKQPSQAYLLTGESGTGKTTTARIMALSLNCLQQDNKGEPCLQCASCKAILSGNTADIIEVNAADHRGIGDIRALCQTMMLMPLQLQNKVYILDECFPGETLVMVDYNKALPIKDVVENDNITQILSYNLKTKSIEPRRITCKYKRKYNDKIVKIYFSDGTYIRSTHQHKYYVNGRGYTPAEALIAGDKLIEYAGAYAVSDVCPHCDWTTNKKSGAVFDHIMKVHRDLTSHKKYTDKNIEIKQITETCKTISKIKKKFYTSEVREKLKKKQSETQKGRNNSIFTYMTPAEVSAKASINPKKFWASLTKEERARRIKVFINAPKYKYLSNKCKKEVISWGISGLEYVGDGSLFITLCLSDGSKIHKNPDFVYKQDDKIKKIIEVMDFEYWHTTEEAEQIVKAYKKLGYDCLIVDTLRVKKDKNVRGEIEAFVNNHYREIAKVEIENYVYRGPYVYDVEVENNHNFFVAPSKFNKHSKSGKTFATHTSNPVLVSNCHQLTNDAQSSLLKELEEAPPHVYIILCSTHPQKILPTVKNRCQKFKFCSLRRTEMFTLIEEVATLEGEDFPHKVYEAVTDAAGGSPRNALVLLQQVVQLGSKSLPDVLRLIDNGDSEEPNVFAICLELNKYSLPAWSNIVKLYNESIHLGAPGIGMMIAGFFRSQLLKAKTPEQAATLANILELFIEPLPSGKLGENMLVLSLFKAFGIRKNSAVKRYAGKR